MSSVPEAELSVGTVHVASFASQTLVVTSEQVALLSQFVNQLLDGRPCPCFFHCHEGFKFIAPRFAKMSACTSARRLAAPIPLRSAFLALRCRFRSGSNRFAASSATTSAKEFASMWWKPILFCVMTDGPTSSKCDLTLMTSVTPLPPSISWKWIDHKSPLGPCSKSPCA